MERFRQLNGNVRPCYSHRGKLAFWVSFPLKKIGKLALLMDEKQFARKSNFYTIGGTDIAEGGRWRFLLRERPLPFKVWLVVDNCTNIHKVFPLRLFPYIQRFIGDRNE